MISNDNLLLNPFDNSIAQEQAIQTIENERSGTQVGLYSRFTVVNKAILKYFRFQEIVTLAGASGSGKSYLANMLRTDFTDTEDIVLPVNKNWSMNLLDHIRDNSEFIIDGDWLIRPAINKSFPDKILFLDFCYEMSPRKEFLRTLSSLCGFSYKYLLSSSVIGNDEKGNPIYNSVTNEELDFLNSVSVAFVKRKNIMFINTIGTVKQIKNTVLHAKEKYKREVIVKIDHSLLAKKENGQNDLDIQNEVIRACIELRDTADCLCLPILQTNNELEDEKRRMTPALHYPTKKDLYAGGQVFQGSDYLFVQLMPGSLGIGEYGINKYPTKDLIHLSMIKSRNDTSGQIWLLNGLDTGKLYSAKFDKVTKTFITIPNLTKS